VGDESLATGNAQRRKARTAQRINRAAKPASAEV
jgi:hypothetical protein